MILSMSINGQRNNFNHSLFTETEKIHLCIGFEIINLIQIIFLKLQFITAFCREYFQMALTDMFLANMAICIFLSILWPQDASFFFLSLDGSWAVYCSLEFVVVSIPTRPEFLQHLYIFVLFSGDLASWTI